jgi:hypothetical protein
MNSLLVPKNVLMLLPGIGFGTTFSLTLPLYYVPDASLPPNLRCLGLPVDEETAGIQSTSPLHILVCDDSMANRKLLCKLLERRGHTCEVAADGLEAVELLKMSSKAGTDFDTILLDYEMPNMVSFT